MAAVVGTSSSAIFFTHAVATLLLAIAAPQPDVRDAGDAGRRLDEMRDAADGRGRSGHVTSAVEMVEETYPSETCGKFLRDCGIPVDRSAIQVPAVFQATERTGVVATFSSRGSSPV